MAEFDAQEEWVPLLDYAVNHGVSLSTLRRYIKSGKVQYRIEDGRYLLLQKSEDTIRTREPTKLESDLMRAQEEITELKMLVALYEEKISSTSL